MTPFPVHLWQKSVRILLLSHWSRWWSAQSPCTLLKARACIRVIPKVTPYPLFQWSTQSNKNLLNLNILFKNNYSSCTGTSSENIRDSQVKWKTGWNMKLSSRPKLVEKLVWVPDISFCEIFIPNYTYTFDALLCQNWPFLFLFLPLNLGPRYFIL